MLYCQVKLDLNKYEKRIIVATVPIVLCGCSDEKSSETKAPIRVKTEVVSVTANANSQSYVGVVEESEATAVSFASMASLAIAS